MGRSDEWARRDGAVHSQDVVTPLHDATPGRDVVSPQVIRETVDGAKAAARASQRGTGVDTSTGTLIP